MRTHVGLYSAVQLRQELIRYIHDVNEGLVLTHSFEPEYLQDYLMRQTCGLEMQIKTYSGVLRPEAVDLLVKVMIADLERVNTAAALVAWLSMDGFRWHRFLQQVKNDPVWRRTPPEWVPEDLAYGLVLQYPEGVLRMAAHVLDLTTKEEVEEFLGPELYQSCEQRVRSELKRYTVNKTQRA